MRYYYKNSNYFHVGFDYDPDLVKEVKQFTGAQFNPANREWYIPFSLAILAPFKKWLDERGFTEGVVYRPSQRVLEYQEPEPVISPEDVLKACKEIGLTRVPRFYQAEGIAYMINHGNCINGDDCGLGKTLTSICVVELMNAFPALVICPASVKYNWKKEWAKINPNRTVGVVESKRRKNAADPWVNDVVVINFDILGERGLDTPKAKHPQLLKKYWGSCVIDEIHFLKSEKALRTKMAKKIATKIENVWGLTGTLTQKRPADLIQPFKIIRRFKDLFGDSMEFKFRYCNAHKTPYGFDVNGFSNLEELHELLRMGGYIRRNKRDVLEELPPLITTTVDVPITNQKEYSKAEENLVSYLEQIDITKANSAVNAPHLVMMQTLKKLSIEGKMQFIEGYIKDWLEANEDQTLLVFGVHRDPLQQLATKFKAPVIQGGVDGKTKQRIVDEFSQGRHRVLFANIKSAGTGTDGLQENCSNLVYIELPDSYSDIEQVNSRLERMGQKGSINVTRLLSPITIDVEMNEMMTDKSLVMGVINRGESENVLLARKILKNKLK